MTWSLRSAPMKQYLHMRYTVVGISKTCLFINIYSLKQMYSGRHAGLLYGVFMTNNIVNKQPWGQKSEQRLCREVMLRGQKITDICFFNWAMNRMKVKKSSQREETLLFVLWLNVCCHHRAVDKEAEQKTENMVLWENLKVSLDLLKLCPNCQHVVWCETNEEQRKVSTKHALSLRCCCHCVVTHVEYHSFLFYWLEQCSHLKRPCKHSVSWGQ